MVPDKEHLYERYSNYTDKQILVILQNHNNYQTEAVDCAVKIAVERGLINSEQDLYAPEYQQSKPVKFSLFPISTDVYQQQRLAASILRFLYVLSLVPIIYGFLKYGEGQLVYTVIGFCVGLSWFSLCFWLKKTRKTIVVYFLLSLFLLVLSVIGVKLLTVDSLKAIDVFMYIVGFVLPVYLLLLLRKLLVSISENA